MTKEIRFSKLTLTGKTEIRTTSGCRKMFVQARCVCGKIGWYRLNSLKTSNTTNCGCLRYESNTIHRKCGTPIYKVWHNMKSRCQNPNTQDYHCYGGRGIKVCKRWQEFKNFYEDMGEPPSNKHTLDRINNNKGYSKKNCRWSGAKGQSKNRRCTITYKGESSTESSLRLGGKDGFVYRRIKIQGWSKKKAFTTPRQIRKK